ncbi:MAG: hypothetical protein ABL927_01250 [Bdellovibrionales bacterium]
MNSIDISLSNKADWIEVFPFGIAMGVGQSRPVMIFKDKSERRVLPVWLSPVDAGIAVVQGNSPYTTTARAEGSPHELSLKVLKALGAKLEKCLFKKMESSQQFIELHFTYEKKSKKKSQQNIKSVKAQVVEVKTNDAISFCLSAGCKFFTTLDYIDRSRIIDGEIQATRPEMQGHINPHTYLN